MLQYIAILLLATAPVVAFASPVQQPTGPLPEERLADFTAMVTRLHEMEAKLRLHRVVDDAARQFARQSLKALQDELPRPGTPGELVHKGYRLRLLVFLEEWDQAAEIARELAVTRAWAGEGVYTLRWFALQQDEHEKLHIYQQLWVDLFPIGSLTSTVDHSRKIVPKLTIDGTFERPIIPRSNPENFRDIGKRWEQSGWHHEASLSYREAIFCGGHLSFHRTSTGGWLSMDNAPLWLSVAENDWRAGRQSEAFESLAKAMVFGRPRQFAAGKQLAQRLAQPVEQPADEPARLDAQTLLGIIARYREMNAHPRALQLLDEHAEVLGERLEAVRKEVATEWLERVRGNLGFHLVEEEGEIYLYGHNVFPEENRMKVTIPPPLRKDVIKTIPDVIKQAEQP